ncbi:hypothetical protein QVD99_002418 [Batrachochytrium dendrobatidis]|nr:hypothetical protein O5D80_006646 [Batrachochytrium dendrobatidis]KAK5670638.1 hypothetical protein QVD99_002418 [Batrachochytrium dendrobatidis]
MSEGCNTDTVTIPAAVVVEDAIVEGEKVKSLSQVSRPTDEEILSFERQIKAETLLAPLVGDMVDFTALQQEYASGLNVYVDKIKHLKSTCLGMRNVRKDGNCFYRAFGFRLAELVFEHRDLPWNRAILQRAKETKALMTTMGYDMSILEDFWERFQDVLLIKDEDADGVIGAFQTDHISDTVVCYLRLITAALLKRDRDIYEAFVLGDYSSLECFISDCVEPMNVESDQIHIVAMANIFQVDIRIANLDTSVATEGINFHEISPMEPMQVDQPPTITLLYRPGHYDVLYPKPIV